MHPCLSTSLILQQIFLELSQLDLLIVQRVCRTWCDEIRGGKALQAALFFRPALQASIVDAPTVNPLLQERFPAFFDGSTSVLSRSVTDDCMGPWFTTHWAEHVRPWPTFNRRKRQGVGMSPEEQQHRKDVVAKKALDERRTAAYRRPEASWRRMLPCSPPPRTLQLVVAERSKSYFLRGNTRSLSFTNNFDSTSTEDSSWLTFGTMYDTIADAWFNDWLGPIDSVTVDYKFEELQPHRHWQALDLQPEQKIGGSDTVLVVLEVPVIDSIPRMAKKRFKDDFHINLDAVDKIPWSEQCRIENNKWGYLRLGR